MIIELMDGRQLDIADYNLKRLRHHIPSITVSNLTDVVDGRDGNVFLESTFDSRTIRVELLYESYDIEDYYTIRDEVNALFVRKQPFYIIFKGEPYKRYKVRLSGSFELEPDQHMNSFIVSFICEDLFGESIATTKSIKAWDSGTWGWNGAITWDDDLTYSFNSNSFTVHNLGNVHINPRQSFLEITLKGSFTSQVTITNHTTGNIYTYNGGLTTSDTLLLKGIQSFKNGTSVFRSTNKKLISLGVGDNQFTVAGGTVSSIDFDFRFLYM